MAVAKKRTLSGGRKTRSLTGAIKQPAAKRPTLKRPSVVRRIKPKRLTDAADIDSLSIEPGDDDAKKSVKKIKKQVDKRQPQRKSRGPSGVTRSAVDRIDDPPPASGVVLIERVLDSIERELTEIDKVTGNGHVTLKQRGESERRARTLASLAKTLGEVTRLRGLHDKKVMPANDAAVPRDLAEFRRELARRLDALSAQDQGLPVGGDDGDGDPMARGTVGDLCAPASEAT